MGFHVLRGVPTLAGGVVRCRSLEEEGKKNVSVHRNSCDYRLPPLTDQRVTGSPISETDVTAIPPRFRVIGFSSSTILNSHEILQILLFKIGTS